MKLHTANAVTIACLLGLALLEYGWIIYPPLGTAAALIQLAAFLTILIAACISRIAAARERRKRPLCALDFPRPKPGE